MQQDRLGVEIELVSTAVVARHDGEGAAGARHIEAGNSAASRQSLHVRERRDYVDSHSIGTADRIVTKSAHDAHRLVSSLIHRGRTLDLHPPQERGGHRANAGHGVHTVKDGDSLPSIAYQAYGDATVWRAIAEANDIENPLHIRRGRSLSLPKLDA